MRDEDSKQGGRAQASTSDRGSNPVPRSERAEQRGASDRAGRFEPCESQRANGVSIIVLFRFDSSHAH